MNQIAAAEKSGIKHIVRLSALGVENLDAIKLQKWHYEVEKAIKKREMPYTIIRPNTFMQNYIKYHAVNIKSTDKFYLPVEDKKVSFIDTRDIAKVILNIMKEPTQHQNKIYELTGPQALSNSEIAAIFTASLGRQVDFISPSVDEAKMQLVNKEALEWQIDCLLDVCNEIRKEYKSNISDQFEKIVKQRPINFEQFVNDNIHYFK